jgi:hypothetical protein
MGDKPVTIRWLFVVLLACNGGPSEPTLPDHGPPPTLSGALLSFDVDAAHAANDAALPPGFTGPQRTVCAPDVTLGFLQELADHLTDPQVFYEWAPIVAGPSATQPTLLQPEFFISGSVTTFERSGLDIRPDHPFGFDTTFDFHVDDAFLDLVSNRAGDVDDENAIHAEIESGIYPDAAFGLAPTTPGDRVLLKGSWIYDCGHPPYDAELHPPTFFAMARPDGQATVALAFANPYRNTQLYGAPEMTASFGDDARFDETNPFPTAVSGEVVQAALGQVQFLSLHSYLEETQFEPLTWFVCAPSKPAGASTVAVSYRFVARTGVSISVAVRGTSGCIELHAEQGATYRPFVPARMDKEWPWAQINAEAQSQLGGNIDIRQLIIDTLAELGFTADIMALHEDVSPIIDIYAPLMPRPGADADSPTEIVTGADDQPFPFYGRVRVSWE